MEYRAKNPKHRRRLRALVIAARLRPIEKLTLLLIVEKADGKSHECALTIDELAWYANCGNATMAATLVALRGRGLLVADKDPKDRRRCLYVIDIYKFRELPIGR